MNTQPDFKELLALLNEHAVEYMIVGGYAVAFHGVPRFTRDIGIFYEATEENIGRLMRALGAFGFEEGDLAADEFRKKGTVLSFGVAPVRVDLLNDIDGITYAEAKPNVVCGTYGGVEANFIGLQDLLRNKRASSRGRDKADIEELT